MAGVVTQDQVYQNHTNSLEPQGYRPFMSQDAPIGHVISKPDGPALHQEASNSDLLHGPFSTTRLRLANTPHLHTERENDLSDLHLGRARDNQFSRLPVTSINHLLYSEPPSRADGPRPTTITPRARCRNCDEFVTHNADGNSPDHWGEYCLNCQTNRIAVREASPSVIGDNSTCISDTPAPAADSGEAKDTNTAFRRRKVQHYESERLALLERDPQIDKIEEYRVLCSNCDKWIQLRKDRPYCPIAWTAHKLQCVNRLRKLGPKPGPLTKKVKHESISTSTDPPEASAPAVQLRRTEEERVKFLVADPNATNVEPHRILCAICGRWIQLRKNSTYCTAPWVQHVQKCAARHDPSKRGKASSTATLGTPDQEGEDEPESEEDVFEGGANQEDGPPKRGRGRPRKRKHGHAKGNQPTSFALRPVSGPSQSLSNTPQENGPPSVTPPRLRTPSPLPNHPYSSDMYWYPSLPPMSSYYSLYAGSQYNEGDDSYSLYFHAQPPAQQPASNAGQNRVRAKPPTKARNTTKALGGSGPSPKPLPSESTNNTPFSPGPEGSRAWIVWRLKNYATNACPMDPPPASDTRFSVPRAGSEVSGSGSEPLPMYRSGTWPHLLDPEDPSRTQNLSPYVHPETASKDTPPAPGTHSAHFGRPSKQPPSEDPGLISFNSSAHIPIRASETFRPPLPLPLSPHSPHPPRTQMSAPDPNIDPSFSADPRPVHTPKAPEPPKGIDLDSKERRLAYTYQSIAYLFSTSYQGADDMSLDTLTNFMNRCIPQEKMYDGQEVSGHVAILGERKQLVFTKEGGVQLLGTPPP